MQQTDEVVELVFPVHGNTLPVDHSYLLFSAMSEHFGDHIDHTTAIQSIRSEVMDDYVHLDETSRLRIRSAIDNVGKYLPLAGKTLKIDGHKIKVGLPEFRQPYPGPLLYSRMVAVKGCKTPEATLKAVNKQLARLGIESAKATILQAWAGHPRVRSLRIRQGLVFGYAMTLEGLSVEDSQTLISKGIGGRRHMGCGVFFAPIGARREEREVREDLSTAG